MNNFLRNVVAANDTCFIQVDCHFNKCLPSSVFLPELFYLTTGTKMLSSRILSKDHGMKGVVKLIIHLLDVSKGLR